MLQLIPLVNVIGFSYNIIFSYPCQGMQTTHSVTVDDIQCAFFDQVERLRHFGSHNKESIAQLVWAFFNYWAYHHDYANDVISIRTGSIIRCVTYFCYLFLTLFLS